MKTYQITLPAEDAELVDKMLQDGPWDSIDELFLNSIGTLQEDVAADENVDLDDLRAKIQVGLDDIDAGRVVDGEEMFRGLMERFEKAPAAGRT